MMNWVVKYIITNQNQKEDNLSFFVKKIVVQIFLEKVSFLNFRYLFRYLLLGFSSALGSSQKQKSEKKWAQMISKAPKISRYKNHVGVERNIKTVVEDSKNLVK